MAADAVEKRLKEINQRYSNKRMANKVKEIKAREVASEKAETALKTYTIPRKTAVRGSTAAVEKKLLEINKKYSNKRTVDEQEGATSKRKAGTSMTNIKKRTRRAKLSNEKLKQILMQDRLKRLQSGRGEKRGLIEVDPETVNIVQLDKKTKTSTQDDEDQDKDEPAFSVYS